MSPRRDLNPRPSVFMTNALNHLAICGYLDIEYSNGTRKVLHREEKCEEREVRILKENARPVCRGRANTRRGTWSSRRPCSPWTLWAHSAESPSAPGWAARNASTARNTVHYSISVFNTTVLIYNLYCTVLYYTLYITEDETRAVQNSSCHNSIVT